MPPSCTYGFIGLGNMGYGMALNVRKNMPDDSQLLVCELNRQRMDKFVSEARQYGPVDTAPCSKDLCEAADVIITSMPNGKAIEQIFSASLENILAATPPSDRAKLFIDTSTIEVSTSLAVLAKVQESGLGHFIDAPVSGGIPAAAAGELTFMVGGPQELFERVLPILRLMGKQIFHCGKPGAGLATKQINNYIAYNSYLALCEGMNAGVKYGLDPKVLSDVINASSGCCWNSLYMNPVKGVQANSSASRDFQGGFKTELAKGVIDMAVQLMDEVGAKHVLGSVVKDVYARAMESPLCRDQESRSVYRLFTEDDGGGLGTTKVE